MDFMEGLTKSNGKDAIMVIVDKLSKYGHFIALTHPYSTSQVAKVYLEYVYELQGMLETITNEREPTFMTNFW